MKLIIFLMACVTLTACNTIKKTIEQQRTSEKTNTSRQVDYIEKKDTTFNFRPQPEKSQNRLLTDTSFLETSLAWSVARYQNGILLHNIQNKPFVPVRVPAAIQIHWHDSRDSVRNDEYLLLEQTVTKEKYRFLNPFFYYSGCIAWGIIIIITSLKIWKTYKRPRILPG